MLEAALGYAAKGWRVFPVKPEGKVPLTSSGLKDATTDEETIRAWWAKWPTANIGYATGNGIVVVDIDELGSWTDLLDEVDEVAPDTSRVATSRGWHLFFRTTAAIRNSAGKLREGIDIRGDGGYTILPPSHHEHGHVYAWEKNGIPDELPAWLLERLTAEPKPAPKSVDRSKELPPGDDAPYGRKALEAEAAIVAGAQEGYRRDRLNTAALKLGGLIAGGALDETEVSATLADAARLTGLPEREIETTIANGIADGKASPRSAPEPARPRPSRAGHAPLRHPEANGIADALRPSRHLDGWEFVFSVPETVPAIWGERQTVAWAKGEGLFIVGPDGVGKTTLLQQLMLGRIGLRDSLLGLPIERAPGRVLYLSCDRPRQAANSLRRMVSAKDEAALRDRLAVWRGPLPVNPGDPKQPPRALLDWIRSEFGDVSDVYVDSLKDIALDLSKDETGSRVNLALQELIAEGIETVTNHHQRKEQQGGGKPKRLADVYGSRWLTAGQGSVVLLWGEPGDAIVELSHLKQPVDVFGPVNVMHDHSIGSSTVHEPTDLLASLAAAGAAGLTPADAARLLFSDPAPDRNLIERARRRLNQYVTTGLAVVTKDDEGAAHYALKEAR
jgi:replicative DNA helicase